MRFCPFAQRTRLVLAHKGIPYETINIDLASKPSWFLERNPKGQVPVLQKNGKVITESRGCNEYLDQQYPEKRLQPEDPAARERHKHLMDRVDTELFPRYVKLIKPIASAEEKQEKVAEMLGVLDTFDKELKQSFFGGDQPAMIDVHIWPFLERLAVVESLTDSAFPSKERFPRLHSYVQTMSARRDVMTTMQPPAWHAEYLQGFREGKSNYNIGL